MSFGLPKFIEHLRKLYDGKNLKWKMHSFTIRKSQELEAYQVSTQLCS